jgi:hypothetical protein
MDMEGLLCEPKCSCLDANLVRDLGGPGKRR